MKKVFFKNHISFAFLLCGLLFLIFSLSSSNQVSAALNDDCMALMGEDGCYIPPIKKPASVSAFTIAGNSGATSGYTNTRTVTPTITGANITNYSIKDGSTSIYNSSTKPTSLTLVNSEGSHTLTLTVTGSSGNTVTKTATIILDTIAPSISVSANPASGYAKSRTFTITLTETNPLTTSATYYFTTRAVGTTLSDFCTGYSHTNGTVSFSSSKTATITKSGITGSYYLFIEQFTDKAGNTSSADYTTTVTQKSSQGVTTCALIHDQTTWKIYYSRYGTYQFDNGSVSLSSFSVKGNTNADSGYTNTSSLTVSFTGSGYYYEIKAGSTTLYSKSTTKPTAVTLPSSEGSYTLRLTVSSIGGLATTYLETTIVLDKTAPVVNVSANPASGYAKSRTYTVTINDANRSSNSLTYYFTTNGNGKTTGTWCTSYSHTDGSVTFNSSNTGTITRSTGTGNYYLFIERARDKAGNYSDYSYTTVVSQQNTSGTTSCAMLADGPFNIYYARYGYHQFDNQTVSISSFSATGNTTADSGYTNTRTITLSISATASYYQITDIHNSVSDIVYTKSSTKPTSITLPDTQGSHKLTLTVYSIGSLTSATQNYTIIYDNIKPVVNVNPDTEGGTWVKARSFTITVDETNLGTVAPTYYFTSSANGSSVGTWCTSYSHANGYITFNSTTKSNKIEKLGLNGIYYLFIESIRDKAGNVSDGLYKTTITQKAPDNYTSCTLIGPDNWDLYYSRYGFYQFDNQTPDIISFSLRGNINADNGYTNTTSLTVSISANDAYYYELLYGSTVKYSKSVIQPTSVTIPTTEGAHTITLKVYSIGSLLTDTQDYTIIYDITAPKLSVSPSSDSTAKASRTIAVTINDSNPRDSATVSYYFSTHSIGVAESEWCNYYKYANGNLTFTKTSLTKNITYVPGLGDYYLFIETFSDKAGNISSHTHTTTITQATSTTEVCTLIGPESWDVHYARYGTYRYDPIIPDITSISATGNTTAKTGYSNIQTLSIKFNHTRSSYYKIVDSYPGGSKELKTITSIPTTSSSTEVTVQIEGVEGTHTISVYVYSPYQANVDSISYNIIYDIHGPASQVQINKTDLTIRAYFTDTYSLGGEELAITESVYYIMSPVSINRIELLDDNTKWLKSSNPMKLLTGTIDSYYLYLKLYPLQYVDRAGNNLLTSTNLLLKDIDGDFVIFHHQISNYTSTSFDQHSSNIGESISTHLSNSVNKYRNGIGSNSIEFNESNTLVTVNSSYKYAKTSAESSSLLSQGYQCMKEAGDTPYACSKTTTSTAKYKNNFIVNISIEHQIINVTITKITDITSLINEVAYSIECILKNESNNFYVSPVGVSTVSESNAYANVIIQTSQDNYLVPLLILNNTPSLIEENSASSELSLKQGEELGNIAVSFADEENLEISTLITHNGVKADKINTNIPGVYEVKVTARNDMEGIRKYTKTIIVNEVKQEIKVEENKVIIIDNQEDESTIVYDEEQTDNIISNTITIEIIKLPAAIVDTKNEESENNSKRNKKKNKEDDDIKENCLNN